MWYSKREGAPTEGAIGAIGSRELPKQRIQSCPAASKRQRLMSFRTLGVMWWGEGALRRK